MTDNTKELYEQAFEMVCEMLEMDDDGALGLISPIRQCAYDVGLPNEQWPDFFDYCYRRFGIKH